MKKKRGMIKDDAFCAARLTQGQDPRHGVPFCVHEGQKPTDGGNTMLCLEGAFVSADVIPGFFWVARLRVVPMAWGDAC